jgi:2-desacetyl-2-hydroxyethyl bacteriochlorophyllide A dehydrogenase
MSLSVYAPLTKVVKYRRGGHSGNIRSQLINYSLRTVILNKPGELKLVNRESNRVLKETEVLLKVRRIGICGTDYHAYGGKQPFFSYPRVLGHELGAEVIEVGGGQSTNHLRIGDKVAVEPYLNCGHCQSCRMATVNCCESIQVLGVHTDGGMTELIKVPANKVHVSSKLSFDQLALVEMLSIGAHAVERAAISERDKVLIIGAGPIGLSVAEFVKLKTTQTVIADYNQPRLDFARQNGLAKDTLKVENSIAELELRELYDGDLPTIVIDATGNANSMAGCFNLISHGGKIILVGLFQGDLSFFDPNFHKRELTLMASRNSLPQDFKRIIQLMEEGTINTDSWLSHRTDLENLPRVFSEWLAADSGVIKAIVEINF